MFYKVSRASECNDAKPCEGAVRKSLPYYHVRTCKSFEEFDSLFATREGNWLSKGTEHCLTPDGISRREGNEKCWVVKISNLKQLHKFIEDNGTVIVDSDSITIYDSYIE